MCWGRIPGLVLALTATASGLASCRVAHPDVASCRADLRLLAGACVAPNVADTACGARARSTLDGCSPRPPCEPGRALDLATGECLARRGTRALAAGAGVIAEADDAIVECREGGELVTGVLDGVTRIGCLPPRTTGAGPLCPPGAVAEGASCRVIVDASGRIDVATWARDVLGADGGPGAAPLCRGAQESILAIAVTGTQEIAIDVAITMPDNDVSQLTASVRGGGPELEHAVSPLIEALRALGAGSARVATQALVSTRVRCRVRSDRPATQIR